MSFFLGEKILQQEKKEEREKCKYTFLNMGNCDHKQPLESQTL